MSTLTLGSFAVSTDDIDLGVLTESTVLVATATTYSVQTDTGEIVTFQGTGFTYNAAGIPSGGVVTRISETFGGQLVYNLTGLNTPVPDLVNWALTADNLAAKTTILAGADTFSGSAGADLLRTYDGDDYISGFAGNDSLDCGYGNDTVYGGIGEDIIVARGGTTWLRGEEGNDQIYGGTGFDYINGNQGDDSVTGGIGNDWVVGGQNNDIVLGETGDDVLNGNLGSDTIDGATGIDWCRGGQGDDVIFGRDGDDWLSGDKGDDTITGGLGADTFHTSTGVSIDRVTDFNAAEGDRVRVDLGSTYTVRQVGADTVVDMGGGDQMILVGVQSSTLPPGWIFVV